MTVDATYTPKVYREHGGARIMIKTAGATPGTIEGDAGEYTGLVSYQPIAIDLPLGGAIGAAGKKLSPIMGNVIDPATPAAISTSPIVAGVIGAYSLSTNNASTYPSGAIAAQISDAVNDTTVNAIVAYIDGDSATTIANAAFKVMSNNSIAASGFHYGLDLQDAAHDGYQPVDSAFYLSAPIRIVEDVVLLVGTATPTDGVAGTGAGVAGKGSLHLNTSDGKLRSNTNTKASPTWTIVGTQA